MKCLPIANKPWVSIRPLTHINQSWGLPKVFFLLLSLAPFIGPPGKKLINQIFGQSQNRYVIISSLGLLYTTYKEYNLRPKDMDKGRSLLRTCQGTCWEHSKNSMGTQKIQCAHPLTKGNKPGHLGCMLHHLIGYKNKSGQNCTQ